MICFLAFSITKTQASSNGLDCKFDVTEITDTVSVQENCKAVYRLFKTQNTWTFIKLNTRTGQMWQMQFDVQGEIEL